MGCFSFLQHRPCLPLPKITSQKWPGDCVRVLYNLRRAMRHRLRFLFPLLPLLLLTASCSQRIYFPDSAPSYGFREKGHVKAFVASKAQGNSNSSDPNNPLYRRAQPFALAADAGYAFASRWGVYGAYRGVNNTHRSDIDGRNSLYNGRRAELGAVYFAPMGKHSDLEAMAGVGQGMLEAQSQSISQQYSLSFLRYSLQGAISFKTTNDEIRGYGGMRLAVQDFYRFSSPDPNLRYTIGVVDPFSGTHPAIYTDITSRSLGVIEPFLGFEAGYRWIRFIGQSGFTVRYFGPHIGGESFYMSAGIGFQWPVLPEHRKDQE
jgi:hypothetical protein